MNDPSQGALQLARAAVGSGPGVGPVPGATVAAAVGAARVGASGMIAVPTGVRRARLGSSVGTGAAVATLAVATVACGEAAPAVGAAAVAARAGAVTVLCGSDGVRTDVAVD